MATLPSRYIPRNCIGGQNCYFDTGVIAGSDVKMIGLFYGNVPVTSNNAYYFGARNTNSTSSAGQFNFLCGGQGQTAYLGYGSARLTASSSFNGGTFQVSNIGNVFDVYDDGKVNELTGTSSAFTGTKTIYLLALNNAGSPNYGTGAGVYEIGVGEVSISKSGTEQVHYIPVYDTSTSTFGLYDLVSETFSTHLGTGSLYTADLLEVTATSGGDAWIMTDSVGYYKKKYIDHSITSVQSERLIAMPKVGYEFLNWTDQNGNVLSTDTYFEFRETEFYVIQADAVITANFVKITDEVQMSRYQLLGLEYGVGAYSGLNPPIGSASDIYALVKSFTCESDMTSQITTTIELEDIPSGYQTDMPVFLFSPRGKMIWCGVIKSIDGNTLTCREPISIFDLDIAFLLPDGLSQSYRVGKAVSYYLERRILEGRGNTDFNSSVNGALKREMNPYKVGDVYSYETYLTFGDTLYVLPAVDTGVANAEDYMLNLSNGYGFVYESSLYDHTDSNYPSQGIKHLMYIRNVYPSKYGSISIGTNSEAVSNVEIVEQERNANSLMVYDSAGSTLRGIYGVKNDGSIEDMTTLTSDFLAYSNCENIVVTSDDPIKGIVRENLGNATLNHKITFDVDLRTDMFRFDDFKLGRRVAFYIGDKVYNSMITALSFGQTTNDDIRTIRVTLGTIRTKLTAKLNLGKKK